MQNWYLSTLVLKSFESKLTTHHQITTIHFHLGLPFIKDIKIGTMNIMIQHTSASISVNECWDDSVRVDMEMMLNRLVPESAPYTHTLEGPDDMPAHVKCSLMGSSVTIPICEGRLGLGTWQGVWLCEHRDRASAREFVVTVQGCES